MTRPLPAPKGIEKTYTTLQKIGIVVLAIGILALIYPYVFEEVSAISIGAFMILGGHFRMTFAIASKSLGSVALKYLFGLTMIFSGTGFVGNPDMILDTLTMAMVVYLIVDAITAAIYGFTLLSLKGGPMLIINALITLVMAVLVFFKVPESSSYFLGIFIGVKLVLDGVTLRLTGDTLKKAYA